ncbi:MAG: gliding motility-associated ABC transporter ATP-binding subunit GldA [Ferruginibacter sp.]
MSISVSNLSKQYGAQTAVNNISFTVGKGEIVGFLGPNGAGKSTTMKMITGYLGADGGHIEVCGITANEDSIETKKRIGYLPEANPLYFDMYVREYLSFIAGVHQIADAKARVEAVITTVGLIPESHKKIGQLSKGYKQRVGLAAAMVHDPEVLILDEPTSGLDPNQIVEIRNVIKELAQTKTILFSSHIMQEVEALCDRVIIINKGNIVADDRLSNLQKNNTGLQQVTVEFKEAVNSDDLKKIKTVTAVTQLAAGNFQLSTPDAESVKKQLLQLSIEKNWDIVSLQTQSQSLENVFRGLTGK